MPVLQRAPSRHYFWMLFMSPARTCWLQWGLRIGACVPMNGLLLACSD